MERGRRGANHLPMRVALHFPIAGLTLAAAVTAASGQTTRDATRGPTPGPSRPVLFLTATGAAAAVGLTGAETGYVVYTLVCQRRHRDDRQTSLFGPCSLPSTESVAIGWFAGSVLGATGGATAIAAARGCPRTKAARRAFAGALVGAAPGLLALVHGSDRYPARRTAVILATPLTTGVGAAAAVMRCRGAGRR
jgi:hypothetical protein